LVVTSTRGRRSTEVGDRRVFNCATFFAALDEQRCSRGLDWNELAVELWRQSPELNAQLMDHGICQERS
jgi:hypothetical protein